MEAGEVGEDLKCFALTGIHGGSHHSDPYSRSWLNFCSKSKDCENTSEQAMLYKNSRRHGHSMPIAEYAIDVHEHFEHVRFLIVLTFTQIVDFHLLSQDLHDKPMFIFRCRKSVTESWM